MLRLFLLCLQVHYHLHCISYLLFFRIFPVCLSISPSSPSALQQYSKRKPENVLYWFCVFPCKAITVSHLFQYAVYIPFVSHSILTFIPNCLLSIFVAWGRIYTAIFLCIPLQAHYSQHVYQPFTNKISCQLLHICLHFFPVFQTSSLHALTNRRHCFYFFPCKLITIYKDRSRPLCFFYQSFHINIHSY